MEISSNQAQSQCAPVVQKIKRNADLMCTAHSILQGRYRLLSDGLDIVILSVSLWVVALSFVDSGMAARLTPGDLDPQIFTGALGATAFFFSLLQLRMDWRGKSDLHDKALSMFAAVKKQATAIEYLGGSATETEVVRLLTRYDAVSDFATPVPDSAFLKLKRDHKLKIAVSKILDDSPGTCILMAKIRVFWRDRFGFVEGTKNKQEKP